MKLFKISSFSSKLAIWLFPIFAFILCGWIFFNSYQKRGPMIQVLFEDASGLQAERTQVRFRGVAIGLVKMITISEDTKFVIAHIRLDSSAVQFATEGSKFWVVSPKVTFQGISGLETLFEGTYISASPGGIDNPQKLDFKASSNTESTDSLENTTVYSLDTPNLESISAGDAVTFRGLQVGSVTKVSLSKSGQLGLAQLNIQNRYVHLVRTNTYFWRKVGISADLGLFGSKIKVNSIDSIMRGGVDFFTPNNAGTIAKAGTRFNLNSTAPVGYEKWSPNLGSNTSLTP